MNNFTKKGFVALAVFSVFATAARAQSTDTKADVKETDRPAILLSIGPDANLPIGNFKDFYNWSVGGSVQGDYAILGRTLYVSVNAGYDNFFTGAEKLGNSNDLNLVPVLAGLKYFAIDNFYVEALAGVSFITDKSGEGAEKSAVFAYSPQIGYLFHLGGRNYIDAGVKFQSDFTYIAGQQNNNFFGVRIAYGFGL